MPRRLSAVPLALLLALIVAGRASAAEFTVTTTADGFGSCPPIREAQCTLRAAINAANSLQGQSSTISVPAGTYVLNGTALPAILETITIAGAGRVATTISGNGLSRVFTVSGEEQLALRDLTVADGSALGQQPSYGGNILVGNTAFLYLTRVRVTGGRSLNGGGIGLVQGRALIVSSL